MSTEIHTLEGSRFGTVRDGSEDRLVCADGGT
jgi:hypothetical protein